MSQTGTTLQPLRGAMSDHSHPNRQQQLLLFDANEASDLFACLPCMPASLSHPTVVPCTLPNTFWHNNLKHPSAIKDTLSASPCAKAPYADLC
jgi:hypothetical protein